MHNNLTSSDWDAFSRVSQARRAIRDFDGEALDEADLQNILSAALLAPSSGNLQPYQLHLVSSPELKKKIAQACNDQRAAQTAGALVVVVSSLALARRTLEWQAAKVGTMGLSAKAEAYHRGIHKTMKGFLRIAPFSVLDALRGLCALFLPVVSLLPFGSSGMKQWAARNSIYAVQNLLLAATARGLDSCPMEGFNALKISRLLQLPRGSVIPVVVALGRRRHDALVEPQMRRDLREVVVSH